DRDELGVRVALVGQEEQAGVQAAQPVRAVHEVVAAAQHAGVVVHARVGQADVRLRRDPRMVVLAARPEVELVELAPASEKIIQVTKPTAMIESTPPKAWRASNDRSSEVDV